MALEITDDEQFFQALAAQDPAVLESLYEYAPRLEQALRQRFSSAISTEDIKDIVRDGLIRAFRTGDRLDPKQSKLTTWLNRLVHYEALDYLRHNPQSASKEIDELVVLTGEHQPQDLCEQPSESILRILDQLSSRRKEVILLYYYERLSNPEIARQIGISEAAARSHRSLALSDLRRKLKSPARQT